MKLKVQDITIVGLMVAVIEVCKVVMAGIPNVELTTFWIIMFTLCFGKKVFFVIPVFILIEGTMYGIGSWWVMYLYLWPSLAAITYLLRHKDSALLFAVLAGAFGYLFGFFAAITTVLASLGEGFLSGLYAGFVWWVAGIPWDLVHGTANFVLMLILYRPIRDVINKFKRGSI